uniref:Uncharacterized protein n=1 Tax=Lactuca sativa TaxID=4236 RepID=A0A9R1V357_LACSA|nr:hypothetical protein LSAT_V11C700352550 [Lactuca sativa]
MVCSKLPLWSKKVWTSTTGRTLNYSFVVLICFFFNKSSESFSSSTNQNPKWCFSLVFAPHGLTKIRVDASGDAGMHGFFGFQHKSPITCYNLLLFLQFKGIQMSIYWVVSWSNVCTFKSYYTWAAEDNQQIEVTKHKTQMLPVMQFDVVCVCSGL